MSTCGDNSSPLCICFTDAKYISGITALTYSQKQDYTKSWNTFRTVELYNSNVSTLHDQGNTSVSYWKFASSEDISYYKTGALLYYQYLGYSSIVQKN